MADKFLHTRHFDGVPRARHSHNASLDSLDRNRRQTFCGSLTTLLYPTTLYFVLSAHTARRMSYKSKARARGRATTGGMYFAVAIASPRPYLFFFFYTYLLRQTYCYVRLGNLLAQQLRKEEQRKHS